MSIRATCSETLVDMYVDAWPNRGDKVDSETIVSLNGNNIEVVFEAYHDTDISVESVTVYADGIDIGTFDMRSDEEQQKMTDLLLDTLEIEGVDDSEGNE